MREEDFPFAVSLTQSEGWGFSAEDFARFVAYEPRGCLLASIGETPVGLITSVSYGEVGWIGNVIVVPEYRHRTIGKALLQGAIDHQEGCGVPTIRLNAYESAVPFYQRFGFTEEHGVQRYIGALPQPASAGSHPPDRATWQAVLRLDRRCFGADRSRVLTRVAGDFPSLVVLHAHPSDATGFALGKVAPGGSEIGPLVCLGGEVEARELLSELLSRLPAGPIELGLSEFNPWAASLASSLQFRRSFRAVQMRRGPPIDGERPATLVAIGGFEKG